MTATQGTRHRIRHKALGLATLGLLAASPALAGRAADDGPGRGFVGIAANQAIRVNLVRIADDSRIPPDPCRVEVAFLDMRGDVAMSVERDLAPDRGDFVELLYSDLLGRPIPPGTREPIRVRVTLVEAPHGDRDPNVVPTVELYDTRTDAVQEAYETVLNRPRGRGRP